MKGHTSSLSFKKIVMSIDILLKINGKSSNVRGRRRKSPFPSWNDIPNHQRRRHSCLIKHSERSLQWRKNGAYAGASLSTSMCARMLLYIVRVSASTQNYSQARRINTARIVRALRRLDKQTPSAVVRRAADLVWLIVSRLIALSLSRSCWWIVMRRRRWRLRSSKAAPAQNLRTLLCCWRAWARGASDMYMTRCVCIYLQTLTIIERQSGVHGTYLSQLVCAQLICQRVQTPLTL
jgi:hypothetical protein